MKFIKKLRNAIKQKIENFQTRRKNFKAARRVKKLYLIEMENVKWTKLAGCLGNLDTNYEDISGKERSVFSQISKQLIITTLTFDNVYKKLIAEGYTDAEICPAFNRLVIDNDTYTTSECRKIIIKAFDTLKQGCDNKVWTKKVAVDEENIAPIIEILNKNAELQRLNEETEPYFV